MELTKEYFEEHLEKVLDQKLEEKLEEKLEQKFTQKLKGFATKDDLDKFVTVDYFDKIIRTLATQDSLDSVNTKVNSIALDLQLIKEQVTQIDKRDLEDSNAFAQTLVSHGTRIARVERRLKIPVPKLA